MKSSEAKESSSGVFFLLGETKHSAHILAHSASSGKRLLLVVQQPKLTVSSLFTLVSIYCWLSQPGAKRWLFGACFAACLCIRFFTLWCSHYDQPKLQRQPIEQLKNTNHLDRLYWHKHTLLMFSVWPARKKKQKNVIVFCKNNEFWHNNYRNIIYKVCELFRQN